MESKAVEIILLPKFKSSSADNLGLPHTCSILFPRITLGAPVVKARLNKAVMKATGIPAFSISLAIVAPQRLHVPQVATIITAFTFADFRSCAISRPILLESATGVPLPDVLKYSL